MDGIFSSLMDRGFESNIGIIFFVIMFISIFVLIISIIFGPGSYVFYLLVGIFVAMCSAFFSRLKLDSHDGAKKIFYFSGDWTWALVGVLGVVVIFFIANYIFGFF